MKTGEFVWFKILGKEVCYRISSAKDGYSVGLLSVAVISGKKKKALRIVLWRLAVWIVL